MAASDCIFCKIVAGDLPAHFLLRSERVAAFLDIGPLAKGHVLLIPNEHVVGLEDMTEEISAELGRHVPALGKALMKVTGAEGFNLLANSGRASGQDVMHVHWHLIPRVGGDNLGYRWNAGKYEDGVIGTIAEQYRQALNP